MYGQNQQARDGQPVVRTMFPEGESGTRSVHHEDRRRAAQPLPCTQPTGVAFFLGEYLHDRKTSKADC